MTDDNGSLTLSAPSSRTLSDHVADELRRAILTDRLKPGQRIVEREIAEAMDTSRGPVRDGLKLLENEGLVVRYPHRGTFVARLTERDAEEIYSLRVALETLAAEYAIRYATDEQLDELDALVQAMATKVEQGYTEYDSTDLDLVFHRTLCRISGHKRVISAWENLNPQLRMLLLSHRTHDPADFREKGVQWHSRLVAALRQRDMRVARNVIIEHLAASFEGALLAVPDHKRSTG
ncbi:MAG: GntR family transcriptional regulator [Anaerolineales bacterium]|nr:GntR family transcriptional regulator [Anaerolineales bacterium]